MRGKRNSCEDSLLAHAVRPDRTSGVVLLLMEEKPHFHELFPELRRTQILCEG